MVRGCVIKRVKDLNQLPSNNEISTELSPTTLLTGEPSSDFLQVIKLNFGDFAHSYNAIKIKNTPKSRVVGVVALYPSGNEESCWIFMPLATGREIHRNKWVELLIDDEVLERIKGLTLQEGHPPISTNFVYKWRNGKAVSESVEIDNNSVSDYSKMRSD